MPSVTKLLRIATLPETRRLIATAYRSDGIRDLVNRARFDRAGLVRDLANPATTARLVREALGHPATRELVGVGAVLLPGRYLPAGWAATWLLRRVLGRFGDGPVAGDELSGARPSGRPMNVTPGQGGIPPLPRRDAPVER